ncbi:helix-turn-helix domain-containing protein [Yinghuangia seranimata]|uniref:helix-turn-helix domain-containing protein n=1 Tax=Yinghuangia seranimata TaxID=408067 RepID=UPI00248C4EE0|nr:XRE family transcriptional regulator [Yinghuangia seranimata]MDI2129050.1 XRE family transcriptional regulator [Yinghuangia seranimata]
MRPVSPQASDAPVRIGAKLRGSRLAQGMTVEQVAAATRLSKGFISKVERDETSPSVATLVTLCQALSLPIGSLFEEAPSATVELADAPLINMGGTGAVERLVTPRAQAKVQVLRSTLEPGADGGRQLYTINCEVEVIHVVTGRITVVFATHEVALGPGATLTFPGREPHTWRNTGEETAEVLWVITPAAWSGSN